MVSVIEYRPLSALQPIRLEYDYGFKEKLNRTSVQYGGGLRIESINAFKRFKDVSLNKGNCLILTNTVKLSDVFIGKPDNIETLTGTVLLQIGTSTSYFMCEEKNTGRVTVSRTPSFIHAISYDDTKEIELMINGKFLQIEEMYPYTVFLSETSLVGKELFRQRFIIERHKNVVSFRVNVPEGSRYLAFNNDDILRATGVILNNTVLNNYKFNAIEVASETSQTPKGFIPETGIVSYYMSFEDKRYNKNVYVKERQNVDINLLGSFSIYEAAINGTSTINFANLRTNYTPEGTPITIPLTSAKVPIIGTPPLPISEIVPPLEPPPPPPEVIPDDSLLKEDNFPLKQENNYYIRLE